MLQSAQKEVAIDAAGLSFRDLNLKLREEVACGAEKIILLNVCGQRYIGTDLDSLVAINIVGTPGNNLGSFMEGPNITVYGNAQDGSGNTMNEGRIVVHGHAGDITGLAARGGRIFVRDDVGYRAGIHMKEYEDKKPALVIGGTAQDFVGEYMAGGVLIMLGLNLKEGEYHRANYIGTGMHGGVIYIRGEVDEFQLGKEVGVAELTDDDLKILSGYVNEYAVYFDCDADEIMGGRFIKLYPRYLRPYGRLYAY
ncbi:hypothetical protein ACFLVP_03515 [Chloroflexota bacterium]